MASATTEEELNKLLDQIEEEIGKDMELTQDLLDILNDEARLEQEEGCELEPMDEDEVNIIHYLSQLWGALMSGKLPIESYFLVIGRF